MNTFEKPVNLISYIHKNLSTGDIPKFCHIINYDGSEHQYSYYEFIQEALKYYHRFCDTVKPGETYFIIIRNLKHLMFVFLALTFKKAIPCIFPYPSNKVPINIFRKNIINLVKKYENVKIILDEKLFSQDKDILEEINNLTDLTDFKDMDSYTSSEYKLPGDANFNMDDYFLLQHTSGTVDIPKGILLTHRSLVNQIENYNKVIKLTSDDRIITWLPLYHDMGLIACFIMPVFLKIPFTTMDPFDFIFHPKKFLEKITEQRATFTWLPNFCFNLFGKKIFYSDNERYDLSSLKAVISCSEPVLYESISAFVDKMKKYKLDPGSVSACYAMAENTFAVTQTEISRGVKKVLVSRKDFLEDRRIVPTKDKTGYLFVSNGIPICNNCVKIVDDGGHDLEEKLIGEIAIKSDSMMGGYFDGKEFNAGSLRDGWHFTGDLGFIYNGDLYISGRKKDIVIIGGSNIHANDIEYVTYEFNPVIKGRSVAFGILNEEFGTEELVLLCEIMETAELNDLRDEIRKKILYKFDISVNKIFFLKKNTLIKTTSGKISRMKNKNYYLEGKFLFLG